MTRNWKSQTLAYHRLKIPEEMMMRPRTYRLQMRLTKIPLRRRTVTRIFLQKAVNSMKAYIPTHYRGKQVDLEAEVELTSEPEAKAFFNTVKSNLLNINRWYDIAMLPAATFVLTDSRGREKEKAVAEEGDLVRIDVPGPGTAAGDGYDWVQVEKIQEEIG